MHVLVLLVKQFHLAIAGYLAGHIGGWIHHSIVAKPQTQVKG